MHLNIVPASQGLTWLRQGFNTFMKRPFAMLGIFMMFMLLFNLLGLIPFLGVVLGLVLLPSATLGLMQAARSVYKGDYPFPTILFSAFHKDSTTSRNMLVLGALYGVVLMVGMSLTQLIDGGQFVKIYLMGEGVEQAQLVELMSTTSFQISVFTAGVISVLVGMLFWHAPALVYWHNVPPVKSMFFSVVACLRNFKAFFVYLMAFVGIMLAIGAVGSMALIAIAGAKLGTTLLFMVMMLLSTVFFTSQYFSFVGCFGEP